MKSFPYLPGEGSRLASREYALCDDRAPPRYLMCALRLLASGASSDGPLPDAWRSEFDANEQSREAIRDIATDFGLRSISNADGTVGQWIDRLSDKQIIETEALRRVWVGYSSRLLADLEEREETPEEAEKRIAQEWVAWRAEMDEATASRNARERERWEQEVHDFNAQKTWPLGATLLWVALRSETIALHTRGWEQTFPTDGWVHMAALAAYSEADAASINVMEHDPHGALLRACATGRVKVLGMRDGQFQEIDVRLFESGMVELRERDDRELLAHPRGGEPWRGVVFDVRSIKRAFPAGDSAQDDAIHTEWQPATAIQRRVYSALQQAYPSGGVAGERTVKEVSAAVCKILGDEKAPSTKTVAKIARLAGYLG